MSLVYLASPYTHVNPLVRAERFDEACKAAAKLMKAGMCVFSPIAHSHPVERYFDKPEGMDFWLKQDFAVLQSCTKLLILTLDGWEQSKGVAAEMEFARKNQIPLGFVEP